MKKLLLVFLVLFFGNILTNGKLIIVLTSVEAQTATSTSAEEIIKKLEQNRVFDGLYAEGSIIVQDKYGTRTTTYISKSMGSDYSLIEYTSSAEKGQKDLRVKDNIYLYYPDAEQVITLNKSMFQQSMLDSDISYEDLSGDKSILDSFTVVLEGEETREGIDTYRLYLSAKNERKETYPYQRIWVRKDNYTILYAENFTRKKKLRKTFSGLGVIQLPNGVYYSSEVRIKDVLKKGEGTTVKIDKIELRKMDSKEFSIDNLKF